MSISEIILGGLATGIATAIGWFFGRKETNSKVRNMDADAAAKDMEKWIKADDYLNTKYEKLYQRLHIAEKTLLEHEELIQNMRLTLDQKEAMIERQQAHITLLKTIK